MYQCECEKWVKTSCESNKSLCFVGETLLVFFGVINELQIVWKGGYLPIKIAKH